MTAETQPRRKLLSRRNVLIGLAGLVVICIVCAVFGALLPDPEPIAQAPITVTSEPPAATQAPAEPGPTSTPEPTATAAPTDTPLPTATPEPPPDPVTLTGSGDAVPAVDKFPGPAVAHLTHTGSSNFAVWAHYENGDNDLLVNIIGSYTGTRPLDFLQSQHTRRLEIQADGSWTVEILPLASGVRRETIPGQIAGRGDDVIGLEGSAPDTLHAVHTGSSNFAIWSWGETGRRLVVNEIGAYDGTTILDPDVFLLVIEASGSWTLDITAR